MSYPKDSELFLILQKFLNNFPSMIGYWDNQLINKFSNSSYQLFFQKSSGEIFGQHMREVLGEELFNKNLYYINEVLKGNEQVFERMLYKNKIPTYTQAFYIPDKVDGEVQGFFVLVNDISKLKEVEDEKNEIYQKLVESSRMIALGEMAGGIAHEINNPLSIINMNAVFAKELLDDYDINRDKLLKYISIILSTSNRIDKIIKGLQFFSQEGASDDFTVVPVKSIIENTTSFCLEKIMSKKISFMQTKIDEELKIVCSPTQLSQVLLNLLNNSVDAIEDLEQKWISLVVEEMASTIEISIVDSGSGIAANDVDKVMQPFFTTKKVGKGTGLGLSISKGIIEKHDGKLSINQNAKNTTFVITLPKVKT